MAQGDLKTLIEDIQKDFLKTTTESLRKLKDTDRHKLYVSKKDLKNQMILQFLDVKKAKAYKDDPANKVAKDAFLGQPIKREVGIKSGNTREQAKKALAGIAANPVGLDESDLQAINSVADQIFANMVTELGRSVKIPNKVYRKFSRNVAVRFRVTAETITATFIGVNKANVFDAIKDKLVSPSKLYIKNQLLSRLKLNAAELRDAELRFIQLGHVTAISDFRVAKALNKVNTRVTEISGDMDILSQAVAESIRSSISSRFKHYGGDKVEKQFLVRIVKATLEAETTNLVDSNYEAANIQSFKDAMKEALVTLSKPIMGMQESSDSAEQAILNVLFNVAKTRGAKVKGLKPKNAKPSSAKANDVVARGNKPKPATSSSLNLGDIGLKAQSPRTSQSAINLQNLIPMLNQKLPDLVKSNMGKNGALHNRTGRFAESVEVLSISGDGLNVGFTYQTDPYAVFESQGNRDPRRLIDVSIRQAAAGIMNVRFSTGRVR